MNIRHRGACGNPRNRIEDRGGGKKRRKEDEGTISDHFHYRGKDGHGAPRGRTAAVYSSKAEGAFWPSRPFEALCCSPADLRTSARARGSLRRLSALWGLCAAVFAGFWHAIFGFLGDIYTNIRSSDFTNFTSAGPVHTTHHRIMSHYTFIITYVHKLKNRRRAEGGTLWHSAHTHERPHTTPASFLR